ncbi:hypothetical protein N7462_003427 [Penicillium macrosclerotiorum]|uniref:uncharacterized protein n=1 Tax=Penicillium macrosclerotiorum TaxID=303699 RepID=UPI002547A631|nr:uncharacterized protein N7462_003427 [Penicillium macrosclerotiorum]KAJ5689035.1 hypothetical protein N7462_003427 [Penicillium macrosclerotiorum]
MGRLPHDDLPDSASSHSLHSIVDSDDLPPPYSDEPDIVHVPSTSRSAGGLQPLRLIEAAYALPDGGDVKPHSKRVVTLLPALSSNADELYPIIRRQLRLPVRPILYVKGTHTESSNQGKEKKSNTVTDFDFKLDLAETMLTGWEEGRRWDVNWSQIEVMRDGDDRLAYRGGMFRSRDYKAPSSRGAIALPTDSEAALLGPDADGDLDGGLQREGSGGPDIDADLRLWCERFCRDPSSVKSFTLRRRLAGFDHTAMNNVLSSHIRELNYRGSVNLCFKLAHSSVTVYSPHWINRLRLNRFVWWICVILQLWILTWPVIWLLEKRYEVAYAQWNAALDPGSATGLAKCYARGRNEAALGEFWAPAVKQAAWSRHCGEANLLTRLDAERLQGMTTEQIVNFRTSTSDEELDRRARIARGEGGFVDNVVGLVRGIGEVGEAYRLSVGWGANT